LFERRIAGAVANAFLKAQRENGLSRPPRGEAFRPRPTPRAVRGSSPQSGRGFSRSCR